MPELVISDTTPIINLLKINQLHLLKNLYGKVIIPESVYDEIEQGKNKIYYTDLKKLDFIEIKKYGNKSFIDVFSDLDKGEADVLLLAISLKADLVIIDEKLARRYAMNQNLKITGTIGILIKSYMKGYINDLGNNLYELKSKGAFIGDKLIKEIINSIS